ncbi:MAG: WD40 repeat domain-containing protein [Planctomycetia bacterium]|nr:WD40 repeat domain-containing protein [Planctomycetia bacterium]
MIVLTEPERKQRIDCLAFSSDGTQLAAAGNGSWVSLWKLDSPNEPQRFFETDYSLARICSVAFWDNNTLLASCGRAGLRVQPLNPIGEAISYSSTGHLVELAVIPRDRRVIGINHRFMPGFTDQPQGTDSYQTWIIGDNRELQPSWSDEPHWFDGPYSLALTPDGRRFVSIERREDFVVKSTADGKLVRDPSDEHRLAIYAFKHPPKRYHDTPPLAHLMCSPTGEWLAAHFRIEIAVWSMANLTQPPRVIQNASKKDFTAIAFHPGGKFLAATCNDETVQLYDTATWQLTKTYSWTVGKMRSVCFSSDGMLAAAGSHRGKVVVWDVDV